MSRAPAAGSVLQRRSAPVLVVVDEDLRVLFAEPRVGEIFARANLRREADDRLPPPIEHVVHELIGGIGASHDAAVTFEQLVIRTARLSGPRGACFAVSIEPLRSRDPVAYTASRYRLSKREREVLELILDGQDVRCIASQLHIAESTVNEYLKHLYTKLGVNTRSKLVARVFDWTEPLS